MILACPAKFPTVLPHGADDVGGAVAGVQIHLVVVVGVGQLVQLYYTVDIVQGEERLGSVLILLSDRGVRVVERKGLIHHVMD